MTTKRLWKLWKSGIKQLKDFSEHELDQLERWDFLEGTIMEYRIERLVNLGMKGIKEEVESCKSCHYGSEGCARPFGRGGIKNPKVLFIAESAEPADSTVPLSSVYDSTIKNLTNYMKLNQDEWALITAMKCVPSVPHKVPSRMEYSMCRRYLLAQITLINPNLVVLLGSNMAKLFTPIEMEYGKPVRFNNGFVFVKFYHPELLKAHNEYINKQKAIIDGLHGCIQGQSRKTFF
jgi:DNA polymerase